MPSILRWARASPAFTPTARVLARSQGIASRLTKPHSQAALGRLLSVRGSGACKELSLWHAWVIGACLPAFREGMGRHLTRLVLARPSSQPWAKTWVTTMAGEVDAAMVGSVLRLLPGLRRLVLCFEAKEGGEGWAPIWAALAGGACPRLERLAAVAMHGLERPSQGGSRRGLDLEGLVRALHTRSCGGCGPLEMCSAWACGLAQMQTTWLCWPSDSPCRSSS